MEMGKLGLPMISLESGFTPPNGYSVRIIRTFFNALQGTETGREALSRFQADENVAAFEGTMIKRGSSAGGFYVETLAAWWLWRANDVGAERATHDLEAFLDSECVDILGVLWVYGLTTEKSQTLVDDIALIPIEEMLDTDDKEYILKARLPPHAGVKVLPGSALVHRYKSKKLMKSDEADAATGRSVDGSISADFRAQTLLRDVALLINCLPGACCTAGYHTSYCPPEVPLGPFGGGGGSESIWDTVPRGESRLEPGHEILLSTLLKAFQAMDESPKLRMDRALMRLSRAKARTDIQDLVLDLGIALEMLLLNAEHNKQELPGQLHLHFRLRAAWLLGNTAAERRYYFRLFRKIYEWRSQVAHNGFSEDLLNTSKPKEEVRNMVDECISAAEQVFQALIANGIPDWHQLILGSNATLERC